MQQAGTERVVDLSRQTIIENRMAGGQKLRSLCLVKSNLNCSTNHNSFIIAPVLWQLLL